MASAQGRADRGVLSRLFSGLNFSFGSSKSCVGLSIGASSVKVVEIKKKGKGWVFHSFASSPFSGVLSDQREIVNPTQIAAAIKDAIVKAKIKSKEVCSSIVGSGVIIKTLSIAVTNMKELDDQVIWEAEQYIPFDINDVVIDYQVLKKTKDNQVDVIVVAVKKDFLEQYRSVIESAKLKPNVMDVEVFALQNCYEENYENPSSQAVLLADVGAMSTKTTICSGGVPLFTKDSPFGGILVTQEIQRDLKLPSFLDAEMLKVSDSVPQEVIEIMARMSHVLGSELKKAIDFYSASSLGPSVRAVYLSGGASRTHTLAKIVEEYVGVPVLNLNPFEKVRGNSKSVTPFFLESIAAEAVIPLGLAIRAGDQT